VEGYSWPEGKRSAFLFSVDVDVESPLAWRLRGKPAPGLAELEQRRFGARQGLRRLLDLLAEHDLIGSFFVPGRDAARYPDLLPAVANGGHELGLHGYHHERVDQISRDENEEALGRAREVFEAQVGVKPRGYRSPAWELTAELHDLLRQQEMTYDSSLMGYDHPYTLGGLTEVPVEWLTDDAVYFRFRGSGLERWHPADPGSVLASWLEEWEGVHEFGGLFTLTVHPWISGRSQRIRLLRRLLERVRSHDDVWFATAIAIAEHHRNTENASRYRESLDPLDTSF
jgi:peptidoglycan/xylan/chitin deacetylase (PgdA/CDA1 family)